MTHRIMNCVLLQHSCGIGCANSPHDDKVYFCCSAHGLAVVQMTHMMIASALLQYPWGSSCADDPQNIKSCSLQYSWLAAHTLIVEMTSVTMGSVFCCSIHVASVVQMTHMIVCHGGLMKVGALSPMQQAASLWSALVHDYEHGGLNNDFLIKTGHPLAITYKWDTPCNHVVFAWAVLYQPQALYIADLSTCDCKLIPRCLRERLQSP